MENILNQQSNKLIKQNLNGLISKEKNSSSFKTNFIDNLLKKKTNSVNTDYKKNIGKLIGYNEYFESLLGKSISLCGEEVYLIIFNRLQFQIDMFCNIDNELLDLEKNINSCEPIESYMTRLKKELQSGKNKKVYSEKLTESKIINSLPIKVKNKILMLKRKKASKFTSKHM